MTARRQARRGAQEAQNSDSGGSGATKRSKYGPKTTQVDGITFSSKREAARWKALQLALRAGAIANLNRQVRYPLHAEGGNLVGHYVADHVYEEVNDQGGTALVVEDVKGYPTPLYGWKKRHMLAEHGIAIREV